MLKKNHKTDDLPRSVGIIYSEVKRKYFPTESQFITEKDAWSDAKVIGKYLEAMGIKIYYYAGVPNIIFYLKQNKPDMVINLVGSIRGQEYLASVIPGILEASNIPYTGAGILGESLSYNKFLTKDLLNSHGVPVPNFQLVSSVTALLYQTLRFPLISKLNEIHGAVEITKEAVSANEKHLRERLKFLLGTYGQPVLVEEFIAGEEVTAMLLEGSNKKVYLAKKVFDGNDPLAFATFADQWGEGSGFKYEKYQDHDLVSYVKKAFDVLRMSDYGKFDVRIDQSGRYYFVDSNSNPAFGPKELDVAMANILDLYDIDFSEILRRLLTNTMREDKGKEVLPPVPGNS